MDHGFRAKARREREGACAGHGRQEAHRGQREQALSSESRGAEIRRLRSPVAMRGWAREGWGVRAGGAEESDGIIVRVRKRNRREKGKAASGALLSAGVGEG